MIEVVELSPLHLSEKLLDDRVQHGSAPHQRLVAGAEEADRDYLQSVALGRQNAVAIHHFGRHRGAQHGGDVGAVHVGIEQSDFEAHASQRDGEVDGQRGLADAALARTDGNDGIDARQRLRPSRFGTVRMCMRAHE